MGSFRQLPTATFPTCLSYHYLPDCNQRSDHGPIPGEQRGSRSHSPFSLEWIIRPPQSCPSGPPECCLISVQCIGKVSIRQSRVSECCKLFPSLPSPLRACTERVRRGTKRFLCYSPIPGPIPRRSFPSRPLYTGKSRRCIPTYPICIHEFMGRDTTQR